ncbi:hypothetical protein Tco_0318875 [Tanacetum coccineum]
MVLNNTKHKILHPWWWYYDDDGGGVVLGGSGVRRVAAGWRRGDDGDVGGGCGGVGASVVRQPEEGAASDMGDRLDRGMGNNFGFGRKSPPENFSGGGGVAVAGGGWWPAVGRERG